MSEVKRTISLMITGLDRGGAETQVVHLARGLASRGHRVSVISLIEPNAFLEELEEAGVEVRTLAIQKGKADPRLITRAVRILRELKPEVLVSFMFHANMTARISGRLARVPLIIGSIRGEQFGVGGWERRYWSVRVRETLIRLSAPLSDCMTTMSAMTARMLVKNRIVPVDQLHVIPNIVRTPDLGRGQEAGRSCRAEIGVGEDDFLFLNIARIHPVKDHPTLLRAFAKASQATGQSLHLAIAGGGDSSDLQALAATLGVRETVHFLGERTDISEWCQACDAVVHSSLSEGLPNALIEGHAHGKPVVATDAGGTSEVVHDGNSGFIVPIADFGALGDAMAKLVQLPEAERHAMGEAGRQAVVARYGEEQVLDRWLALFDEQLAAKKS